MRDISIHGLRPHWAVIAACAGVIALAACQRKAEVQTTANAPAEAQPSEAQLAPATAPPASDTGMATTPTDTSGDVTSEAPMDNTTPAAGKANPPPPVQEPSDYDKQGTQPPPDQAPVQSPQQR